MDGESTANAIEKTSKIKKFSPLLSEKFQLYTQIAVLVMTTASAVQQKILSSCVVGVDIHVSPIFSIQGEYGDLSCM